MTEDDVRRGDKELSAELGAIDASLFEDSPARLQAVANSPVLLTLTQAYQATIHARRAALVALLDNAALPRRLAALEACLETERDALAVEREIVSGLPRAVASDDARSRSDKRFGQSVVRMRIEARLRSIASLGRDRVELLARSKAIASGPKEASKEHLSGLWKGMEVTPLR